jgi:hypothetical protein
MPNSSEETPVKQPRWVFLGAGIHAWLGVLTIFLTTVGGTGTALFFIGKAAGSNQYLLELPAKVEALEKKFDEKMEQARKRDAEALASQIKLSEKLIDTLEALKADLKVNTTKDEGQASDIDRLEDAVNDLRRRGL